MLEQNAEPEFDGQNEADSKCPEAGANCRARVRLPSHAEMRARTWMTVNVQMERILAKIGATSRPPNRAEVGHRAETTNELPQTSGEICPYGNTSDKQDTAMRWLHHLQTEIEGVGVRAEEAAIRRKSQCSKLAESSQVQGLKPAVYT
jgi:hypothetical protein